MIQALNIRNLALIDEIQLELSPGLNVLTGETGAGKSIIIGAVGLILGERGSADVVRSDAESAIIEAAVDVSQNSSAQYLLKEIDLAEEQDEEMLLLSRQISSAGRSRCRINGRFTPASFLRDIGDLLVDIHGQHEHQSLFRPEKHLQLLDSFGGLVQLHGEVTQKYNHIQELRRRLMGLESNRKQKLRERELLEYQLSELEEANLKSGEDEKLQEERKILTNAETLFEQANSIYARLYGGGEGEASAVMDTLKGIRVDTAKLCQIDAGLKELSERLENTVYELEDITREIRGYQDKIEFNPVRLEAVEERLDLIYRLKRKYGDTIDEILAHQANVAQILAELSESAIRITELRDEINREIEIARQLATRLSRERKTTAEKLEKLIENELHTLGMDKTAFKVAVNQRETPDGLIKQDGKSYQLTLDGIDEIEFFISPNVGEELRPLTKIASGGEISRVMLALKTILAEIDEMPSMIFDEIDAGIGGRTAYVIGEKLKQIAKVRQVLCVTHLPQIAIMADAHILVEKNVYGNRTKIEARLLNEEERVQEITRMLGGQETEVTLAHAKEMLERVQGEYDN